MKKIMLFCLLLATATGFADNLVLENLSERSKITIQWANSAREVEEANKALVYGPPLNQSTLQAITQPGKVTVNIPSKAQYFRVLTWVDNKPDFLTNWIDIVPNKTYTLKADQLVPIALMSGTGC